MRSLAALGVPVMHVARRQRAVSTDLCVCPLDRLSLYEAACLDSVHADASNRLVRGRSLEMLPSFYGKQ